MLVADKDNELTNKFSPLDSANERPEIHPPLIISSPKISTKIIIDDEASTRYQNLNKIYSSCSIALTATDPITFEGAKTKSK